MARKGAHSPEGNAGTVQRVGFGAVLVAGISWLAFVVWLTSRGGSDVQWMIAAVAPGAVLVWANAWWLPRQSVRRAHWDDRANEIVHVVTRQRGKAAAVAVFFVIATPVLLGMAVLELIRGRHVALVLVTLAVLAAASRVAIRGLDILVDRRARGGNRR